MKALIICGGFDKGEYSTNIRDVAILYIRIAL